MSNTLEHTYDSGDFRHRVLCIAPRDGVEWAGIYKEPDNALKEAVGDVLKEMEVVRAYVPYVAAMSARVDSTCAAAKECVPLPSRIPLYRNLTDPIDGLVLEPGEAFMGAFGGCGVGIAGPIVAHCARDSLVDSEYLKTKTTSRNHFSVIQAMMAALRNLKIGLQEAPFEILFTLPASVFGHPVRDPERGDLYKRLHAYAQKHGAAELVDDMVHLDLNKLGTSQARCYGFSSARSSHTLTPDGPFAHTRHSDQLMRPKRNLVVVLREK